MAIERWSQPAQAYARVAAVAVLLIALLAMVGWHAHNEVLVQWSRDFAPMQYNTALCLVFGSIGILFISHRRRRWGLILGIVVFLCAAVSGLQYLLEVEFGIDQVLMEPYITTATSHPGRMAPNTALAFMCFGMALVGAALERGGRYINTGNLGALTAAGGAAALLGYAADVEGAYGWGGLSRMAFHTATCFVLLGTGILAHAMATRTRSIVYQLAIPVGLSISVMTLAFWLALVDREREIVRDRVDIANQHAVDMIKGQVLNVEQNLRRVVRNWQQYGDISQERWTWEALALVEDYPFLKAIAWSDPVLSLRWIVPATERGERGAVEIPAYDDLKNILERAGVEKEYVSTSVSGGINGGRGFEVYFPMEEEGALQGIIVAAFQVDELCAQMFAAIDKEYAVNVVESDALVYTNRRGKSAHGGTGTSQFGLTIFERDWQVSITPRPELLTALRSTMPALLFLTGIVIALGAAWLIQVSARAVETTGLLAHSEAYMRSIVRSLPNGLITTDSNGTIIAVNPEAVSQFGYEASELIGSAFESLVDDANEKDISGSWDELDDSKRSAIRAGIDERLKGIRKDGSTFPMEIALTSLSTSGKMTVLITVIDHTERDAVQIALREHEQQFRSIIDNSSTVIYMKGVDSRYILINRRFEELFGVKQGEMAGRTDFEIWPEKFARAFTENDKLVLKSGKVVEREEVAPHKDGDHTYLSVKFPVRDVHGEIYAMAGISTDITERKRTMQAIERHGVEQQLLNRKLRQANEELNQFAYVASHDLQEPLRTIITYCGFINEDVGEEQSEDLREDLTMLVAAAKRMQHLVRDLLQFSRSSRGELEKQATPLSDCVAGAMDNLRELIAERGADIDCDELPVIELDAGLMTQVFQNIIGNAIKFQHGHTPRVRVSAALDGDQCTVSISDNGIGIEAKYRDQIFGPFKRLHSAHDYEGSGIGLAICRKIIERHEGKIWVESGDAGGSVFSFTIPTRRSVG